MTAPSADVAGTVLDDIAPELSRNYADALLGAAEHEGNTAAVLDELDELVNDLWRGQPEFAAVLDSPSVATHEKDRILVQVLEGRALPTVLKFVRVLNRHGRLSLLPSIVRAARTTWDRRHNRLPVLVRSAVALEPSQIEPLRERLRGILGAEPKITLDVDPALIGGLFVQVGDVVYNGSVRAQLDRLRRRLIEEKVYELQTQRDAFQSPN
jgi:F-type H+-transporting ATPase subunit delta